MASPLSSKLKKNNKKVENTEIVLPTPEACKAFGICRTNEDIIAKSKANTYGFIEGPQTRMLFSSENFDFENKFYDTFNYKPSFENKVDPVHTLSKNVIDEVILEFLENKPTRLTHETDDNGVTRTAYQNQTKEDIVLETLRIAPNTVDWLRMSHDHEWGEHGGLVQSVISAIGGMVQSIESFMSTINNVFTDDTRARRIVKTDFTSEWKGTKNISFNIPFILFTAGGSIDAFVRDIYKPIMRINQLIYPKRFTDEEVESLEQEIEDERENEKGSILSDSDEYVGSGLKTIVDAVTSNMPGSRMAFLKPPSHVRITHSSGLFRFARCAITNFNYNYEGPWVKTGIDDEFFNKMQSDYSAILGFPSFMSRGFPCIAKCELTITTLDPLYSDDWQEIYQNADVVEISKEGSQESSSGKVDIEEVGRLDNIELDPNANNRIIDDFSGSFLN